jgi:hypothetical protein
MGAREPMIEATGKGRYAVVIARRPGGTSGSRWLHSSLRVSPRPSRRHGGPHQREGEPIGTMPAPPGQLRSTG